MGDQEISWKYSLKLNTSNGRLSRVWQSYSDEDIYPILKQDKLSRWSKYNESLKNIELEGNTLMELRKFWNATDIAFTSTVNVNKGLGDYAMLNDTFNAFGTIVPPIGHMQRNQGFNTYKNFTRLLMDHLLKKDTISKESYPKSYKCLTKNWLNKDGFDNLIRIIIHESPQLGGDERDLAE